MICGKEARRVSIQREPIWIYWHCPACDFRFRDPSGRLDLASERDVYLLHENNVEDVRYRHYAEPIARLAFSQGVSLWERRMKRASTEDTKSIEQGLRFLDFGCGPGPVIAVLLEDMLQASGYFKSISAHVDRYDPFFFPDGLNKHHVYDVIAASEVVEHFFDPLSEFERLYGLLRNASGYVSGQIEAKQGCVVIQTEVVPTTDVEFDNWYYRRDPTHVSFFSETAMRESAMRSGFTRVEFHEPKRFVLWAEGDLLDL
jgi:SAM-dependent methyltransferase